MKVVTVCGVIVFGYVAVSCDRSPSTGSVTTAGADTLWLMASAPEHDLIRDDASEKTLRAKFGDQNVRADSIELGEGERRLGTVLFPADVTRRLEITWRDTILRANPSVVYLRGKSVWRVYPGVGIGTDLHTLEQLNGKPFLLYGFGWDYGGTVASYERGELHSLWLLPNRHVLPRFSPDNPRQNPLYGEVLGEREFSSSVPGMQSLNPRIYEILFFPR